MKGLAAQDLRRALARHRVLLAAGLAAGAVAAGLTAVLPPPESQVQVLTAARDLPAGAVLAPDDVVVALVPGVLLPAGALVGPADAVGRLIAGPVRRGETLTDVRLLGAGLLRQQPGSVAAPVRIGDADTLELLRVGDRIDILAADPQRGGDAVVVAEDVPVLAVPQRRRTDPGLTGGGLLVVAVSEATALRLAGLGVSSFLSVVLVR